MKLSWLMTLAAIVSLEGCGRRVETGAAPEPEAPLPEPRCGEIPAPPCGGAETPTSPLTEPVTWRLDDRTEGERTAVSLVAERGMVHAAYWRCDPSVQILCSCDPVISGCCPPAPERVCSGLRYRLWGDPARSVEQVDPEFGGSASLLATEGAVRIVATQGDYPYFVDSIFEFASSGPSQPWGRTNLRQVPDTHSALVSRLDDHDIPRIGWADYIAEGAAVHVLSPGPAASPGDWHEALTAPVAGPVPPEVQLALDGSGAPRMIWADMSGLHHVRLVAPSATISLETVPIPTDHSASRAPCPPQMQSCESVVPLTLVVDRAGRSHMLVARSNSLTQSAAAELLYLRGLPGSGWQTESLGWISSGPAALGVDEDGRAYVALVVTEGEKKSLPVEDKIVFAHNRAGHWSFFEIPAPDAAPQGALALALELSEQPGRGIGGAYVGWFGATSFNLSSFPLID